MKEGKWLLCPICKSKTRIRLKENTELKNFPLFCPKCKQETTISVKDNITTIITEPDAEPITNENETRGCRLFFVGGTAMLQVLLDKNKLKKDSPTTSYL